MTVRATQGELDLDDDAVCKRAVPILAGAARFERNRTNCLAKHRFNVHGTIKLNSMVFIENDTAEVGEGGQLLHSVGLHFACFNKLLRGDVQ